MTHEDEDRSRTSVEGELLELATDVCRRAGALVAKAYSEGVTVSRKGMIDLVTSADRASEELILAALQQHCSDHSVLAEESGWGRTDGPYRWVIDPLDGTTNFAHGLPLFCVLIAVQERQPNGDYDTLHGLTLDPLRDELFVATRGAGAKLNGVPISPSPTASLLESVLCTGFGYDRLFSERDNHAEFCRLNLLTQGVRRLGAAGLDLAYVACGRLDGFWESDLNPWDIAPGILTVLEAGGRVSRLGGGSPIDGDGALVVSNGPLHDAIRSALASASHHPINSREGLSAFLPADVARRLQGA